MYFKENTLDDLLYEVFKELLKPSECIKTSRGPTREILGTTLVLENPRARLSRSETRGTAFSALGELCWYLSKRKDLSFIKYYIPKYEEESEDGESIYGGYGPRLFNFRHKYDQVSRVIELLKEKKTTRRAVIQIFDAEDIIKKRKEIPCTCVLQFFIRDEKLIMSTYMRSNDAYLGLPHDIFSFTMIQEIIARSLRLDIGIYIHIVGSLHIYEEHIEKIETYLSEGFQTTKKFMPSMPESNPWTSIPQFLILEEKIRNKIYIDFKTVNLNPYWVDLLRLLSIHSLFKEGSYNSIEILKNDLSNDNYKLFIEKRLEKKLFK